MLIYSTSSPASFAALPRLPPAPHGLVAMLDRLPPLRTLPNGNNAQQPSRPLSAGATMKAHCAVPIAPMKSAPPRSSAAPKNHRRRCREAFREATERTDDEENTDPGGESQVKENDGSNDPFEENENARAPNTFMNCCVSLSDLADLDDTAFDDTPDACMDSATDISDVAILPPAPAPPARHKWKRAPFLFSPMEPIPEDAIMKSLAPPARRKGRRDRAEDGCGASTLFRAIRKRNLSAVMESLAESCDTLEERTTNGDTPLHVAVRSGSRRIVRALVDAGADVHATNSTGATGYDIAQTRGDERICKYLSTVLFRSAGGPSDKARQRELIGLRF